MTHRKILERYLERESVALELEPGELLLAKSITYGAMGYVKRLFAIVDKFEDDNSYLLRARTRIVVLVLRLSPNTLTTDLLCAAYFYPNWQPEAVHQARQGDNPRNRPPCVSGPDLRRPTQVTV